MHLSLVSSDSTPNYNIGNSILTLVPHHRDLGITIDSNLTFSVHYTNICKKAYRMSYFVRRSILTPSTPLHLKLLLYITLVRSNLTYCSQIWRPHLIKDILSLEQVQRRFTRTIIPDMSLDYKSRLANLKLLPLMYFYELQDILFFVKCLQDPEDNLNIHSFVSFSKSSRSSRTNKLSHKLCHTTAYRHFYFNRLVRLWNSLPAGTIDLSLSYISIKKSLKQFFWDHFVHNFNSENPCSFHVLCPCSNCSNHFK